MQPDASVANLNPALLTDCDGAAQKAKELYAAADQYDQQATKLHSSGALAAAMNPGFSSAFQAQLNGEQLGQVSSTIAKRIRAQADELTRLVNETRAGSVEAAKKLRQVMDPAPAVS
ncbi:hypothetical protein GCM10023322_27900 [Rugosimonospora acidiphila]|uniref:Uncharacterized protein n=2 Tax=Rugosimonospora acidiphila TaxID=556531 RepID=A0ABP9RQU4_9ACTN